MKQLEDYPYTGKTEVCLELSDIMVHAREGMRTDPPLYQREWRMYAYDVDWHALKNTIDIDTLTRST